jgi:ubiquinol-cytochrome c reductase cytochrome b subunit
MIDKARNAFLWLDSRLHISELWEHTAGHHIPKKSASWFYVFGSATLLCLVVQIITGSLLAFAYVPSGAEAYTTLEYLTYEQPLGWLLRGIHYWGSNLMVTIMLLHMTQVYLFGAYKYPREITWVSGVILMVVTLGLAFTGQVMRFDEDAYWGLGIGAAIAGRTPIVGQQVVQLMLGGPIIGAETLSRFFSLHVFILPGTILALLALHLRMVLTKGINEYPEPGVLVNRETYDAHYANILKNDGMPFAPYGIWKDLVAGAVVITLIVGCALVFGPKGPIGEPDPTQIDTVPRPDFFFMWIFAIAALMPDYMETVALLVGPVIGIVFLLAVPFFNNTGEKHWSRRPVAVMVVVLLYVSLGILSWLGIVSPWSPDMAAWRKDPIPQKYLEGRTPLELQGALVIQQKQCRNCHAIDGIGGQRGPDLTEVGTRLTQPQLVRQVIQGGGNMPAYGKNLSPYEVDAVVSYMVSLRPKGVPAARDSTLPATPAPAPEKAASAKEHGTHEG